jgi:hypothetical protein
VKTGIFLAQHRILSRIMSQTMASFVKRATLAEEALTAIKAQVLKLKEIAGPAVSLGPPWLNRAQSSRRS